MRISRTITKIGEGDDPIADQGSDARLSGCSLSSELGVIVVLLFAPPCCSVALPSIRTVVVPGGCSGLSISGNRSARTSIPPLSSSPGDWPRPNLKVQHRPTSEPNKHNRNPTRLTTTVPDPPIFILLFCIVGCGVGGSDGPSSSWHTVQTGRQPTAASHFTCPFKFTMPTPSSVSFAPPQVGLNDRLHQIGSAALAHEN